MKYQRLKTYLTIRLMVCGVSFLGGCGGRQAGEDTGVSEAQSVEKDAVELPGGAYVSEERKDSEKEDSFDFDGQAEEADSQDGQEKTLNEFPSTTVDAEEADEGVAGEPAIGRSLTADELSEYTDWVQEASNYGFLLSEWQSPEQINLFEVFYNGAGISHEGTEEEKQAFLERYEREQIETDFFAMSREDVSVLLLEKVGLSYDEILAKGNNSMEEFYFPETDSFCLEVGDTNRMQLICTDGVENAEGTIITLYVQGNDWVKECEVKVEKDSGKFLGNHIMEGDILSAQ